MSERILYGYFRSSAAYRVRIALNLKGLEYRQQAVDLRVGAQHENAFLALNAQGLVPVLVDGGQILTQSLAICEYLDEAYPQSPRLLPEGPVDRAHCRAIAQLIACDIHPLNNLRVLHFLGENFNAEDTEKAAWIRRWILGGFDALERMLPKAGGFCLVGAGPSLADLCLVPQVFNARRFDIVLDGYPNIVRIAAALENLPEFAAAHPSQQPDFS